MLAGGLSLAGFIRLFKLVLAMFCVTFNIDGSARDWRNVFEALINRI